MSDTHKTVRVSFQVDVFFVLNGFMNGDSGKPAARSGDGKETMPDGWYWIVDGMTDGVGPYKTLQGLEDQVGYEITMNVVSMDGQPGM